MNTRGRLTDESFWINNAPVVFSEHTGHEIDKFIRKFILPANNKSVLEIGSFPGPFLATFGKMGYRLNGIDFHPLNNTELPRWLQSQGFEVDKFYSQDFFSFDPVVMYDVVVSFGFIEHFENYKDVIRMHMKLVKPGGILIITVPNFRGKIQYWLHKNFDKVNLSHHNLKSMNPLEWEPVIRSEGFDIHWSGYFGNFWFWKGDEERSKLKKKLLWIIERAVPRIRKILWFQSSAFSAYCGIVAKRPAS